MRHLSITNHTTHTLLGYVVGCLGFVVFTLAPYINTGLQSDFVTAKAAVTPYQTQWLMTKTRRIQIFNRQDGRLWGGIDTGPAEWQVRSCIGANFANPGDYSRLGTCPNNVTNSFETWTVDSWAYPTNLFDVGGGGVRFAPVGQIADRVAIPFSNHVRVNNGAGQGRGWVFRSGLYGVMFSTDDDNIAANGRGKWWAHSEIPIKWSVSGEITTP